MKATSRNRELTRVGNGVIQDITPPAERGGFISFYQASKFTVILSVLTLEETSRGEFCKIPISKYSGALQGLANRFALCLELLCCPTRSLGGDNT